ncbi:MAG TPA: sodium:solute symporter [Steroidobacteraceae bacterium]|nr:sodium:solute symporter [Steroidobacteraceae bacterium]
MNHPQWVALTIFAALFLFVAWLGMRASRWRRGDLDQLQEWGLGGRRFGTLVTWFLVGGDLYTAYTFIAVPALAFGAGATAFFAVPYTILAYPIFFMVFPRLWEICHREGYITVADFVRGRFGNRWLALAITVTGIVATLPYIALQLLGLQVVIAALGIGSVGIASYLPLLIAFVILALFTHSSGLRAPASIAIVKDILIYATTLTAIVYLPMRLGGFAHIFAAVPRTKLLLEAPGPHSTGSYGAYATMALGSALALFLYPHAITGVLSSSSSRALKRNAALLPSYSLLLGLLVLMGFFAIAAGVAQNPRFATGFHLYGNSFSVPALFLQLFPGWFVGIAFAAIGIGALVPAAIMAIASANLYARNIHREFIDPQPSERRESRIAKSAALVIKLGALAFVLWVPTDYAIYLQLLGGIWIIQTLPAVISGAFTAWFNDWALLAGWALGTITGTAMAFATHLTPAYTLHVAGWSLPGYTALYTLVLNLALAALLTPLFEGIAARTGRPATS